MTNPYAKYQTNSVMTASPAELTLMLYNGAIKFCNQALDAIGKDDSENTHTYIMRAQDIIAELRATLDHQYDIATEMQTLYTFIYQLLVEANVEKDSQKLQDATDLIREFREAWQEAMKLKKNA